MKETESNGRTVVDIVDLVPDPNQPRKFFDLDALKQMADSIKENGILQDLLVTRADKGYQILDGERRWRAAKLAGLKLIPIAVREVTRGNELALQLIANQQRQNLTALEEAAAYRKAVDAGQKAEDLAQRLGLSRATVFGRLRLNDLDANTRKALEEGTISVSVAGLAAMVPEDKRKSFVENVGASRYQGPAN